MKSRPIASFLLSFVAACGASSGGGGHDAASDAGPPAAFDDPAADRVLTCTTTTERIGDLYELDTEPASLRTLVRVAAGRPCVEYRVALWVPGPTCPAAPPMDPACGSLEPVIEEIGLYLDGDLATVDGHLVALVERASIRASIALAERSGLLLEAVEIVGVLREEDSWGEPSVAQAEPSEGLFVETIVRDGETTVLRYLRDGRIRPTLRTQVGRAATDGIYEARLYVDGGLLRLADPRRTAGVDLPLRDLLGLDAP